MNPRVPSISDMETGHPLDAIADVQCLHTRHYAMCAQCAADAIRPELERLRAENERMRVALEEIKLRTVQRDLNQVARAGGV